MVTLAAASIPPLRHQPAALVRWDAVFLNRLLDRRIGIWLIVHDTDGIFAGPQCGRRPTNAVPVVCLLVVSPLRECVGIEGPGARVVGIGAGASGSPESGDGENATSLYTTQAAIASSCGPTVAVEFAE
jgi:hypothetical protein